MELFPLLLSLQSKDFFYKDQSLPFKDSDTSFEKRKWNYLNKEMELFLLLLSLQSKNFFNKGQSLPFNDSDTSFEKKEIELFKLEMVLFFLQNTDWLQSLKY